MMPINNMKITIDIKPGEALVNVQADKIDYTTLTRALMELELIRENLYNKAKELRENDMVEISSKGTR